MRKRTGASWHLAAWSTLPTTSRTSACVKPVTGDDVKPACRLTLLRPSLTSSAWRARCAPRSLSRAGSNPKGNGPPEAPGRATKPVSRCSAQAAQFTPIGAARGGPTTRDDEKTPRKPGASATSRRGVYSLFSRTSVTGRPSPPRCSSGIGPKGACLRPSPAREVTAFPGSERRRAIRRTNSERLRSPAHARPMQIGASWLWTARRPTTC